MITLRKLCSFLTWQSRSTWSFKNISQFWFGYGYEFFFFNVRTWSRRVEAVGVDSDGSRHHGNVRMTGRWRRIADDVIAIWRWRNQVRLLLVYDVISFVAKTLQTVEFILLFWNNFSTFLVFASFFIVPFEKINIFKLYILKYLNLFKTYKVLNT